MGADIMMAFDECPPYPSTYTYAKNSLLLTQRWLTRCCNSFMRSKSVYSHQQALFPIVQGGIFKDLRRQAAETVANLQREGNAIGGLSVGEPHEIMYETTAYVCTILPKDKPRYLMGVGTPKDILACIALGVDMFDCVMPTRNARNGMLFTTQGILNIRNSKWANDHTPIDSQLGGYVSTNYSKAYLRHLTISKEILAAQIASIHNLTFYLWLVAEARKQLIQDNFVSWKNEITKAISQKI